MQRPPAQSGVDLAPEAAAAVDVKAPRAAFLGLLGFKAWGFRTVAV